MNNDEAQTFLQQSLVGLAAADPSLPADAVLKDWYLVASYETPDGGVFSRYSRPDQPVHVDLGLLTMALKLDERELGEDDEE